LELLEIERSLRSRLGIETTGTVKVILGRFRNKLVNCGVTACAHANQRWFRIPEEKRTDVNIAESMVDDACQNRCDYLVLISGDSDLVPAVAVLRERFPQEESYRYVPSCNPTRWLRSNSIPLELRFRFKQSVVRYSGWDTREDPRFDWS
jgi:hypothetical protein